MAKLRKAGEQLLLFPEMGHLKDDLGAGLRGYILWDYVMLYRVTSTCVRVEAVIHGARDIEAMFLDD